MNIEDLTVKQCREIAALFGAATQQAQPAVDPFWQTGKCYFIRTVTHHYTGRLIRATSTALILEDAAWIADDGRFAQAVEKGEFSEVEPYPTGRPVLIGLGAVIDAVEVNTVNRSQK